MKTENTPKELTADLFQLHKDIRHAIQEIDTVDFEKRSEIIEKCFLISKEYTSLKLQQANKKIVDYNFELTEQRDLQEREKDRYMKLWLTANNKIKTNYDEVEVLKQQIKSKDEMLEKMAELFMNWKKVIPFDFYHEIQIIDKLLNQYKQGK